MGLAQNCLDATVVMLRWAVEGHRHQQFSPDQRSPSVEVGGFNIDRLQGDWMDTSMGMRPGRLWHMGQAMEVGGSGYSHSTTPDYAGTPLQQFPRYATGPRGTSSEGDTVGWNPSLTSPGRLWMNTTYGFAMRIVGGVEKFGGLSSETTSEESSTPLFAGAGAMRAVTEATTGSWKESYATWSGPSIGIVKEPYDPASAQVWQWAVNDGSGGVLVPSTVECRAGHVFMLGIEIAPGATSAKALLTTSYQNQREEYTFPVVPDPLATMGISFFAGWTGEARLNLIDMSVLEEW